MWRYLIITRYYLKDFGDLALRIKIVILVLARGSCMFGYKNLAPTLRQVSTMNHSPRQVFFSNHERLSNLLRLASEANLTFEVLIKFDSDLLISYLEQSPHALIYSEKTHQLISLIEEYTADKECSYRYM